MNFFQLAKYMGNNGIQQVGESNTPMNSSSSSQDLPENYKKLIDRIGVITFLKSDSVKEEGVTKKKKKKGKKQKNESKQKQRNGEQYELERSQPYPNWTLQYRFNENTKINVIFESEEDFVKDQDVKLMKQKLRSVTDFGRLKNLYSLNLRNYPYLQKQWMEVFNDKLFRKLQYIAIESQQTIRNTENKLQSFPLYQWVHYQIFKIQRMAYFSQMLSLYLDTSYIFKGAIKQSDYFMQLKELSISFCGIGNRQIKILSRMYLMKLQHLHLDGTFITDKGMQWFVDGEWDNLGFFILTSFKPLNDTTFKKLLTTKFNNLQSMFFDELIPIGKPLKYEPIKFMTYCKLGLVNSSIQLQKVKPCKYVINTRYVSETQHYGLGYHSMQIGKLQK